MTDRERPDFEDMAGMIAILFSLSGDILNHLVQAGVIPADRATETLRFVLEAMPETQPIYRQLVAQQIAELEQRASGPSPH